MAFFQANTPLKEVDFVPRELVREEPWGEIWRVDMNNGRKALLVAYPTELGDEVFEEAYPHLERWQQLAEGTCFHFLKAIKFSDTAIPFVLFEDPGGLTLRETVEKAIRAEEEKSEESMDWGPKEQGMMASCAAKAATEAEAYGVAPLGMTPDTIFHDPNDAEIPWKIIPVMPGAPRHMTQLCGGRYKAAGVESAPNPVKMHPDSYSVAFLWVDAYRKDFESPFPDVKELIPYEALRFLMTEPIHLKDGCYQEPNLFALGIDQWVKKQADIDLEDFQKKKLRKKRGVIINFFVDNKRKLKYGSIALLFFAAIGGFIYWVVYFSDAIGGPTSRLKAYDVTQYYFQSIIARDFQGANEHMSGTGNEATGVMLTLIDEMEDKGIISEWEYVTANYAIKGDAAIVEVEFYDDSDLHFANAKVDMRKRRNGFWSVNDVYFRPLVY